MVTLLLTLLVKNGRTINEGGFQINEFWTPSLLPAIRVAVIVDTMPEHAPETALSPQHPQGPPEGLSQVRSQPTAETTREVLAAALGVSEHQVVLTPDLSEIFGRLCGWGLSEGARVAVFEPARSEIIDGILGVGARYVDPGRGADWSLQADALDRVLEDGDLAMVVLGRPCPVGGIVPSTRLVLRCLSAGVRVVVDESWMGFSGDHEESLTPLLGRPEGARLALIRCLDSAWGLSGERAGYALLGDEVASGLGPGEERGLSPRGEEALRWMAQEPERRREHAAVLVGLRERTRDALSELPGLVVLGNRGPWIALRCPEVPGHRLADGLASHGIGARHSDHWSWRDAVLLPVPDASGIDELSLALRQVLTGD